MTTPTRLTNFFTVIGFIIAISLLIKMLGGLIAFALYVLLPMVLVIYLVRFLFSSEGSHKHSNS